MRSLFSFIGMGLILILFACKKNYAPSITTTNTGTGNKDTTASIVPPKTVSLSPTMGFFLDNWIPKNTSFTSSNPVPMPTGSNPVQVTMDFSATLCKIPGSYFGNNTNPYMGQFITEPVLMANLSKLSPNILRFPGGSLSDLYFWNAAPGGQPSDAPDSLLDAGGNSSPSGYWFGNNTANWTFTLDNYYSVLKQTNSSGLITVNYGYARYGTSANPVQTAAHLAANWVRYDKGRTRYWEIGNESYGNWEAGYRINTKKNHDGQASILNGALYGKHFKVFVDSMRKAATEVGSSIKIGGVLYESNVGYDTVQMSWDHEFLSTAGSLADYFIVHNYYTPYNQNSDIPTILNSAITGTQQVMSFYQSQLAVNAITTKPLAMTEWNIFAQGSMQMVSNIAGVHATLVLGELLKNGYGEASRWDLANGWGSGNDQGLFNIGDEPNAPKWNPRPAYYYMYFFQKCMGDRFVSSSVSSNSSLYSYASGFSSGQAGITLVNTSAKAQLVNLKISNFNLGSTYYYYTLHGGTDNQSFSRLVYVNEQTSSSVSGGPSNFDAILPYSTSTQGGIQVSVPAYGAVFLVVSGK